MKGFIVILIMLFFTGCKNDAPLARATTDNENFAVDTLFTKDGCTVYRFNDGRDVYFVKCQHDGNDAVKWRESCGKGCTRSVDVPSV